MNLTAPGSLQQVTVPTALERQGNFSQTFAVNGSLIAITDPLTHAPVPGKHRPPEPSRPKWPEAAIRLPSAEHYQPGHYQGKLQRGPGINNWDLSFFKNFPIKEHVTFQFRWQMYNPLNHASFQGVNNNASFAAPGSTTQLNGQFGQITSTSASRG